jgi:NitT/TauT family transport system substrate-binding protein
MIWRKTFSYTICLSVFFILAGAVTYGQPLEKVIVSYPAKTITSFFVPELARQKGFFREEGIDVQLTYVRSGGVEIAAMLSGEVDYTVGGATAINAIVAGAPLRLAMGYINRVDHLLLAHPKYKTLKDLKGQLIGAQNPGGMINIIVKEIFNKNGMDSDRDVTLVNMGGTQERYISLKSGAAAATLLGIPQSFSAEKEGFRRLATAGDYVPGFSGLVIRNEQAGKNPEQVKRVVRASLKALGFIRQSPQETAQIIGRVFQMAPDIAQMTYDQLRQIMSPDGMFSLSSLQFFIDLARERQKITKEISASQIVELAPLQEVRRASSPSR